MRQRNRSPRIVERRLFGAMLCRVGMCMKDGTCVVEEPGWQYPLHGGVIETWVPIVYCEKHASERINKARR